MSWFKASHRGTRRERKSLNPLLSAVSRYRSVSLSGFAFQACSLNHSDISPSVKSTICERPAARLSQNRLRAWSLRDEVWNQRFTSDVNQVIAEIVADFQSSTTTYGDHQRAQPRQSLQRSISGSVSTADSRSPSSLTSTTLAKKLTASATSMKPGLGSRLKASTNSLTFSSEHRERRKKVRSFLRSETEIESALVEVDDTSSVAISPVAMRRSVYSGRSAVRRAASVNPSSHEPGRRRSCVCDPYSVQP
jgi:hypothetical protein